MTGDGWENYRDPCPKCGARLLGFTKEDYIEHLRENGETLAARIEEELVVEEDCADAKPTADEGFCADATGAQEERCPECELERLHYVKAMVGDRGTIAKKRCMYCQHEHAEYTIRRGCAGATQGDDDD